MNGSTITGTATLTANDDATDSIVDLKGFAPGIDGIVNVYSNTCAQPSASFALISQFTADGNGNVHVAAPVLFHGTNVALSDISASNIVGVYSNGILVACGVIPQPTSSPTLPTTGGTFDANLFLALGGVGLIILFAGLFLKRQGNA
jgi:LPXTG-motif cell wall-anchored protein